MKREPPIIKLKEILDMLYTKISRMFLIACLSEEFGIKIACKKNSFPGKRRKVARED